MLIIQLFVNYLLMHYDRLSKRALEHITTRYAYETQQMKGSLLVTLP